MNYRYSISGLTHGYEAGEYSPNAKNSSIFNQQTCSFGTALINSNLKK
jgi:hypothetical protein